MRIKNQNADKADYLDIVFKKSDEFVWEKDPAGNITFFIENKGLFNFIAQKLFRKPRISQLHLEEFGNFIWKQLDGKKSVREISELVHENFGEKAEPLLPRLIKYLEMLRQYGFVKQA